MTLNSFSTGKPVDLGFQFELEFGNVGFWGGRGNRRTQTKRNLEARARTNNKATHIWRGSGNQTRDTLAGAGRVFSPLRHPPSPILLSWCECWLLNCSWCRQVHSLNKEYSSFLLCSGTLSDLSYFWFDFVFIFCLLLILHTALVKLCYVLCERKALGYFKCFH